MNNIAKVIKNKIYIESIIKNYVQLKKKGNNLIGLCPFHNEKTPSFYVHTNKGYFKCFGCGESGDTFSFIQKYKGITFKESLIFLAKKIGISIIQNPIIDKKKTSNKIPTNF